MEKRDTMLTEKFITIKDYAAKWSISTDTVRRMCKDGRLTSVRCGRLVRIPENAIPQEKQSYTPVAKAKVDVKARLRSILA